MPRLATLVLVVLIAACTAKNSAASLRGEADAEHHIATGRPRLLFIGLPATERDIVDRATGLPAFSTGCVVDDEQSEYVRAYNNTVHQALAAGRLSGLTLGHKLTDYATVDARFEREPPVMLEIDGASVPSPGGRFEVRYARYDDHPDAVRFIYVKDLTTEREQRTVNPKADAVPVLFDHEGTTLLVRDERFDRYVTVDLPRALDMQTLVDPERDW